MEIKFIYIVNFYIILLDFVSGPDSWNLQSFPNNQQPVKFQVPTMALASSIKSNLKSNRIQMLEAQRISSQFGQKRHVCTFCKKAFPRKSRLSRHIQYSCEMNPKCSHFTCTFCPYKSFYKANMERHIRNLHDTGGRKFKCELCNFRSSYTFCVRRHMKTFHRVTMPDIPNQ